ncbi:outer membrane lipid asymmetry maintenance protein MlaD [Corticibacter populi]|uniref:Outer membrane lipid asymmetry maintenance protein MlaD n=1 Tax=Corticibacter populi TaxID=1550736 RepID=A0A3M6QP68_9BURK|nr:outer membrane lipid asymmetry maintenance protein MlaD [Corticibacter populi]RMX04192.1 outer membrane lipid asymmetry maintenance protein MlaD [Corticibacter populi]RZS33218.1 phospholipid/cholesterol/gamma-HCH transport system substrate-binding protein [Corticibacter populi]
MQRSKTDFWVGLFVMLGFAALAFLALQSANLLQLNWNSNTYQVKAYFDNVGGLKPKAAVRSSGVVVGRVNAISFDDKVYRALVVLDMDQRYQFSEDSSLKILTSGLLGDQYVGIDPGYEDANLKQGDTVTSTQSAMVLENLISAFMFSKAAEPAGGAASSSGDGSGSGSVAGQGAAAPANANDGRID